MGGNVAVPGRENPAMVAQIRKVCWEAAVDQSTELEEIDRAVDRNIRDKDRAARIKAVLHQQYDLTRPMSTRPAEREEVRDEVEEFWDNVPI